ncbi:MAG: hypothetical protein AAGA63_14540 [Pseudomonadota bacterium]
MQLVFHTGAHFTEEERMVKCLLRNKELFASRGVVVPGPSRYRSLIRDAVLSLESGHASEAAREVLLDAILDDASADRVLLSIVHLFGVPRAVLRRGVLYPKAPERLSSLASLFAQDDLEVFMCIRNPATFLPACMKKSPRDSVTEFLKGANPLGIRWSETVAQMRAAAPEIPITIWCNEDAPLLWSQVVREIGGLEHGDYVTGGFDLLADIMSKEGMARFIAYLKSKPKMNEIQLRRVMVAFLEKFARAEAVEEEIDAPEWTPALVAQMTEVYDEDVMALARIPGVSLISP